MTATIQRLDHVNLRTAGLDAMVAWYRRILGLEPGPRPGFSFPGAWLYAGERPLIHLVGTEAAPAADPADLRIEHFALAARDLPAFLARLEAEGEGYRLRRIPDFGIVQVNVWDPDGNHIHIDFDAAEAEGLDL